MKYFRESWDCFPGTIQKWKKLHFFSFRCEIFLYFKNKYDSMKNEIFLAWKISKFITKLHRSAEFYLREVRGYRNFRFILMKKCIFVLLYFLVQRNPTFQITKSWKKWNIWVSKKNDEKKIVWKKIEPLYRCKILCRIHFSHSRIDLTTQIHFWMMSRWSRKAISEDSLK